MTTPNLLPCPFCGGKGKVIKNIQMGYFAGECVKCNAIGVPRLTEEYAAISWNTRAAPRWIPVTERLPEENGDYLVVMNVRGVPTRAVRPYLNGWRYCEAFPVTHWMPLPEPPEVK